MLLAHPLAKVLLCGAALLAAANWVPAQAQASSVTQTGRIAHLEPPFWWTGMQHDKLQLMVHGRQIADLEPALAYPGVRLATVTRGPKRNYLFTVAMNKGAKAAVLPLGRFHEMLAGVTQGADVITGRNYPLTDPLTLPARATVILELK